MENKGFSKIINLKTLVILVFIVTLLIMRGNEREFKAYSHGINILDMHIGYNVNDVQKLLASIGQEGRLLYIKLLCIDFLFIVSLALVQNYILRRIMSKAMLNSRWRHLLYISYWRGLLDVIENIFILIMLFSYPMESSRLVIAASFVTTLKFIILGLWMIAILLSFFISKHMENDVLRGAN